MKLGTRVQRTPTKGTAINPVRSFEDIVRMGVGSVLICPRTLDPKQEIRLHTPPPLAELDARPRDRTCRTQDGGDAMVSKERQLTVNKMSITDRCDREIQ